jgi:hypothetical protein
MLVIFNITSDYYTLLLVISDIISNRYTSLLIIFNIIRHYNACNNTMAKEQDSRHESNNRVKLKTIKRNIHD